MLNKLSLRLRLTLISVLLLTMCCLGLTLLLNLSASNMANTIEATPLTPAASVGDMLGEIMPPMVVTPSTTSQAARRTFVNESFLYMAFIVAGGGLLTWFITGRGLRPLRELSQQMNNRTVHNLSEELEVPKSNDEVASLTYSFNEMSHKLDEAFSMQKRFAQSAAHELRTPLTVIKTKIEVFRKRPSHTTDEYETLLNTIESHTRRLSILVKDLLDLTSIDAVESEQHISLKDILQNVVDELSTLAASKDIALAFSGEECQVAGNESLLHRVFYNLIENAIKYNQVGGCVNIRLVHKKSQAVISIADTGTGIPKEERELIFEPFYRVDKSRSRQMGGAGLGLATVKAIVDKHKGQILVEDNPGGGSIFTVTI